jgi:hypothetical protein|tara:strand:+ start:12 stop:344 length:333 start_codon:yes stop_codon:yes gene_type:complete
MKVQVHNRNDGGITISHFSPSLLAAMTGSGFGWSQERIDYEVGKFVAAGKSDSVIRPYMEAVANGGVTESQAIELIRAKNDKAGRLGSTVIEDTDLPSDRYFRNAWEWSD